MMKTKPTVLYLDDELNNLDSFKSNFRREYNIHLCESPIDAYNLIREGGIDIVITDHSMPSMSGVEFLETVHKEFPEVQRVLVTAYAELISVVEAVNQGRIFRILTKPFDAEEIRQVISEAYDEVEKVNKTQKLIKKLTKQNQQFEFLLRQRLLS